MSSTAVSSTATGSTATGIWLSRMSVQLPGQMELVDDILARNGRGESERRMFSRFYGLRQSPTLVPGERMEHLLVAAGRKALGASTASLILYGHTLLAQEFGYRGGFPDWLRAQLGAPDAPIYGISHVKCSSVIS